MGSREVYETWGGGFAGGNIKHVSDNNDGGWGDVREDGPVSLRCSLFYDAGGVGVVTGSKALCYKQSQYQFW